MITPTHYMLLSAALFMIGVIGVLTRRNIIVIFLSIELMLNAVNINLVAFSNQLQNTIGQVFAIFVIAVAAAEAAVLHQLAEEVADAKRAAVVARVDDQHPPQAHVRASPTVRAAVTAPGRPRTAWRHAARSRR